MLFQPIRLDASERLKSIEDSSNHKEVDITQDRKEVREKILVAATDELVKNGFIRTNIATIAQNANVTKTMLYHRFKGKEDILFSIPANSMNELIKIVEDDLEGIWDATSQLSKLIWIHLNYYEKNPKTAQALLECRSQKNFYESDTFGLLQKYTAILTGILTKGIEDKVFRKDLNIKLAQDLIIGVLDFELLSYLCVQEIKSPAADLNHIMNLIFPMLLEGPQTEVKSSDKATRILQAAEQIFAEKGISKAKLPDVAELAGVADGTIYEYFKNKEDILMNISARRLNQNIDRFEDAFSLKTPLKKLRGLIRYHFSIFTTNRNFLKLLVIDTQLNPHFYGSIAYETFKRYHKAIENGIEEGKVQGVFRSNVNSRVFRNLFIGTFSHISIRWFILNNDTKIDMLQEIDQVTDMLSLAVLSDGTLLKSNLE